MDKQTETLKAVRQWITDRGFVDGVHFDDASILAEIDGALGPGEQAVRDVMDVVKNHHDWMIADYGGDIKIESDALGIELALVDDHSIDNPFDNTAAMKAANFVVGLLNGHAAPVPGGKITARQLIVELLDVVGRGDGDKPLVMRLEEEDGGDWNIGGVALPDDTGTVALVP